MVTVFSPNFLRSTMARSERPIRRWISRVRPPCLPLLASRALRVCVERGYHLSFAGTVTFTNARPLRDALAVVPLDRVLVETDAPYLTPMPWRGSTNAPSLIPLTVRRMAEVLGVAVPTLCEALSANSERLYGPW